MGNFLEGTDGKYAKSKLKDWEKAATLRLLAHNNLAESPFGLAKWLDSCFQSMELTTIAGLSHAISNNTFGEGGVASKVDPNVLKVIQSMSTVHTKFARAKRHFYNNAANKMKQTWKKLVPTKKLRSKPN